RHKAFDLRRPTARRDLRQSRTPLQNLRPPPVHNLLPGEPYGCPPIQRLRNRHPDQPTTDHIPLAETERTIALRNPPAPVRLPRPWIWRCVCLPKPPLPSCPWYPRFLSCKQ